MRLQRYENFSQKSSIAKLRIAHLLHLTLISTSATTKLPWGNDWLTEPLNVIQVLICLPTSRLKLLTTFAHNNKQHLTTSTVQETITPNDKLHNFNCGREWIQGRLDGSEETRLNVPLLIHQFNRWKNNNNAVKSLSLQSRFYTLTLMLAIFSPACKSSRNFQLSHTTAYKHSRLFTFSSSKHTTANRWGNVSTTFVSVSWKHYEFDTFRTWQ